MAEIMDLVYRLRADGSDLHKELTKSRKGIRGFAQKARRSLNIVGAAAGGVVVGFAAMGVQANSETARLQRLADSTGLLAEDMGGLQLAAQMAGTDIKEISQAFGDLANKGRNGHDVLKDMRIEFRDAEGNFRPIIDVVGDFAEKIERLGPSTEATALAMEAFGDDGGQKLLPFLLEGRDGLEDMRKEADRLGLTFDEKTGRAAIRFEQDLQKLKLAQEGLFRQVTGELVPVLTRYAEGLVQVDNESKNVESSTDGMTDAFRQSLSIVEGVRGTLLLSAKTVGMIFASMSVGVDGTMDRITEMMRGLRKGFDAFVYGQGRIDKVFMESRQRQQDITRIGLGRLNNLWSSFGDDVESVLFSVGNNLENIYKDGADTADRELKRIGDAAHDPREEIDLLGEAQAIVNRAIEDAEEAVRRYREEQRDLAEALGVVNSAFEDAQDVIDRYHETMERDGQRVFEATRTPIEKYRAEIEQLAKLHDFGAISANTYNRAMEQAKDRLKRLQEQASETNVKFEESNEKVSTFSDSMKDLGKGAAQSLFQRFESALFRPFDQSVEQMVGNFARAIGQMAFEAAAAGFLQQLFNPTAGVAKLDLGAGFAAGGLVRGPGTSTSDSIPARLSDGEYVVRADAVRHHGVEYMDRINRMTGPQKFAQGGMASSGSASPVTVANFVSEEAFESFLTSRPGERIIQNIVRRFGGRR